jgi:16S rRNA (guanine966-N2)-methyltransferase
MRIISGAYRGRRLETFQHAKIRPTLGVLREAVFNILTHGSYAGLVQGASVAEVFCGSGALGLEALSRGAAHCTFIDSDAVHLDVARSNVSHVGAEAQSTFLCAKAERLPPARVQADLVFLDPPYHRNLLVPALTQLGKQGWLKDQSVCVMDQAKDDKIVCPEGFVLEVDRSYSNSRLLILRYQA